MKEDTTPPETVQIPTSDTPTPAITPAPAKTITIGKPPVEKKEEKERVKKEKEAREIVPYIIEPNPKSRAQKKYVKQMEKAPKSRMRLITLDQADIIHGRRFRGVEAALMNPANLGTRSEFSNSFSIIPFNSMTINANTSTRPFVLLEDYFSTGELLSEAAEDSLIAMLGPNGLEVPIDINMPNMVSFKIAALFGAFYVNSGLFIHEDSHIPADFFDILFDGATFDNPYQMNDDLGININAYMKNSVGYGSFVELPSVFGEIRFGASYNIYAGVFSHMNITNLELVPTPEGVTMQGTMEVMTIADTLSLFGDEGLNFHIVDDYMGIPSFTMGYDFGFAWRFKLNRVLPFAPKILKNYFDFQVGIEDLGASVAMNHAYMREITFEASAGDLLATFSGDDFSLDSIMVVEETLVYADSTISQPLGTKLNLNIHYQPISQIMLKFGWSTYITDGLNASDTPNMYYGVDIYPISSLSIHASLLQKNAIRFWEAGIKLYSTNSEFGLKARIYDLDLSITENFSGAGITFNWARYF